MTTILNSIPIANNMMGIISFIIYALSIVYFRLFAQDYHTFYQYYYIMSEFEIHTT